MQQAFALPLLLTAILVKSIVDIDADSVCSVIPVKGRALKAQTANWVH